MAVNPAALALVVVLCALIIWLLWAGHTRAHHLSNRGWVLYLAPGCDACRRQMAILGVDFGYSPAFMCGIDGAAADRAADCPDRFPFWRNIRTGEVRVGVQDAAALRDMAAG